MDTPARHGLCPRATGHRTAGKQADKGVHAFGFPCFSGFPHPFVKRGGRRMLFTVRTAAGLVAYTLGPPHMERGRGWDGIRLPIGRRLLGIALNRSKERRVGEKCVSTCR